jgi:Flp pilus assembly protein TadB
LLKSDKVYIMKELMSEWNKSNNERVKLQYAYGVLALLLLVLAGLVSLVNYSLGYSILAIAFGFTVIFFVNAVGWVMLDAFVLSKLPKSTRKK